MKNIYFVWGKYELNKLTSLPTCGFIAQLVEHRTSIAEVTGSNPVEALIFSGFSFPIAQIGKITAMITLHFVYNRSTNMNYFIYTSHQLWFIVPINAWKKNSYITRLRLVIYEFVSSSTNIPRGLSAYKP